MTALGVLTIVFGWTYPHFLEGASWLRYLYAAPSGLVPCPTLAIVVGLTLVWDGLESMRWAITVGLVGVFHAVLGTVQLGVAIDLLLLIGAAGPDRSHAPSWLDGCKAKGGVKRPRRNR
jgi:hypothetical protein